MTRFKISFMSGNMLKIIAAISMLVDHVGILFFPDLIIFRIIGRLAFPIFSFMIAEGCKYTRNKLRYLLTLVSCATVYQAVYYFYANSTYMCVLVTFSLSITVIYALDYFKTVLFSSESTRKKQILAALAVIASLALVYICNRFFIIDYDFIGCLLPVFASLLHSPENAPEAVKRLDTIPVRVCMMGIGTLLLAIANGGIQLWSMLSIPLLLLYSGRRGKFKMKYFFYIFYPAHLVLLQGIRLIMEML